MHALQSAHTSLEGGILRVLEMLGEERPVGEDWHRALIARVGAALPGKRPSILGPAVADAADETRRFRHRATHNYDTFRVSGVARTIDSARVLAAHLMSDIEIFRARIDPS
jgi:hypothetical protein